MLRATVVPVGFFRDYPRARLSDGLGSARTLNLTSVRFANLRRPLSLVQLCLEAANFQARLNFIISLKTLILKHRPDTAQLHQWTPHRGQAVPGLRRGTCQVIASCMGAVIHHDHLASRVRWKSKDLERSAFQMYLSRFRVNSVSLASGVPSFRCANFPNHLELSISCSDEPSMVTLEGSDFSTGAL